jgi:hypothetical protein
MPRRGGSSSATFAAFRNPLLARRSSWQWICCLASWLDPSWSGVLSTWSSEIHVWRFQLLERWGPALHYAMPWWDFMLFPRRRGRDQLSICNEASNTSTGGKHLALHDWQRTVSQSVKRTTNVWINIVLVEIYVSNENDHYPWYTSVHFLNR